jgi:drug/metabolite transporter (DMT)-like permease
VLGFVFHASALHAGSITVVQALLVVQLLFALPFSRLRTGAPPLPRDWIGTVAVCAGVILLIMAHGQVPQTLERREYAPIVASAVAVVIAAVVTIAWTARRHGQTRTALVDAAAGTCFAVTAMFIVIATHDLAHGGVPALIDWPVVGMAATGLVGAILVQDAFSTGAFPAALTAMTVADPLTAGCAARRSPTRARRSGSPR